MVDKRIEGITHHGMQPPPKYGCEKFGHTKKDRQWKK